MLCLFMILVSFIVWCASLEECFIGLVGPGSVRQPDERGGTAGSSSLTSAKRRMGSWRIIGRSGRSSDYGGIVQYRGGGYGNRRLFKVLKMRETKDGMDSHGGQSRAVDRIRDGRNRSIQIGVSRYRDDDFQTRNTIDSNCVSGNGLKDAGSGGSTTISESVLLPLESQDTTPKVSFFVTTLLAMSYVGLVELITPEPATALPSWHRRPGWPVF